MVQRKGSTRRRCRRACPRPSSGHSLGGQLRPEVLLPLVNVPMIDYTLAWLESTGIEEFFVFCCVHSKQIHEDFVLITGDTVSNMSLTQELQEHKDRREKDNNAVMTMVIKRSKPSPITHQSQLGTDELLWQLILTQSNF
ncbi:Translation initiation factor eIF-2B subunit epsilon [Vitis vinifera]|uniref:Translation initiation factor eIF-2B subunit epsilon n=1 Tax=Vitis vinifera TaxID=29760 RepID=A0A438FXW3_VITVI|nr:Translation initiation factor eIF-2B subunit epsilon [Vitis vinifera]